MERGDAAARKIVLAEPLTDTLGVWSNKRVKQHQTKGPNKMTAIAQLAQAAIAGKTKAARKDASISLIHAQLAPERAAEFLACHLRTFG